MSNVKKPKKDVFKITINDGFCTYEYNLNIGTSYSIHNVITDICKIYKISKPKGKLID